LKNRKASVGFIFITLLLDVIGLGIIIPVIPALIQELTGGSISDAAQYGGWLIASYALVQFLCAPIVGALSDKYGRRPILLLSLLGFGLDYLVLAIAPTIAWLFLARIIAGFFGASFTTGAAYIADVSSAEKRAQNFGLLGAAFGLGFIIGPVTGGLLGEIGPRVPFYAAALVTFLNLIYGYFILPESLKKENRREFEWSRANPLGALFALKRYPSVAGLIGALTFIYLASHAVQGTWAYFSMEKFNWSESMVGYSLGLVGIMSALVQGLLIRLIIPKIGEYKTMIAGIIFNICGCLLFSMASEGWMLLCFIIPYSLGGIAGPAIQGILSNQIPPNEQGQLQGALTSMMAATGIIGPLMMTSIFAYFTAADAPIYFPGAPFVTGAILVLICLFLIIRKGSKYTTGNRI
jgi:DHA1 family tetracycline resistance protein-like MFS transporter|tara:strand:- start:21474 stop:22697 length:1224 start_codon:yes stop_codon:yes gene_type:complete